MTLAARSSGGSRKAAPEAAATGMNALREASFEGFEAEAPHHS